MDLLAFLVAFVGAALAGKGYALAGGVLVVAPLVALAPALVRSRKLLLVLPLDFASWWVILPLGFIGTAVSGSSFPLGFALYYYGCIALVERKVRYGPWGENTVFRKEQPRKYWLWVGVFFTMSGVLLGLALASAARLAA